MSWDKDKSIQRVRGIADRIGSIEITDLQRQMNLDNVTLGKPKRIKGVHVYSAITNEAAHITDALDVADQDAAKPALRAVHLWQRELTRVVCTDFDAAKVHFQGTRLHALVYRPVGDMAQVAARAVAMVHAIELTTRRGFNEVLGDEARFKLSAGGALGATLATRSGSHGDSELLFIGDAANHGAKAIHQGVRLQVTEALVDQLDDEFDATITAVGDGLFKLEMDQSAVEAVVDKYKLGWSLDASRKRIEDDLEATPLEKVGVSKASATIDKDRLSLANSKLNDAGTLFGDIDGFTATVAGAVDDTDRERLVRRFHVIRAELRHVATQSFETLRIQYQGDRIQALRHLPHDDAAGRALRAVRLAAAWQSSMEISIPQVMGTDDDLHLAVALDAGPTAISKLGERGNRDLICLGKPVRRAAKIESNLDGDEIGITEAIRSLLPDRVAALFHWDQPKTCYLAKGLRYNDVLLAEQGEALDDTSSSSQGKVTIPAVGGGLTQIPKPKPRWHP